MKKERRDFLKITTAGAAGLALTRSTPALAAWPSSGTMEINPAISNMRVVACVDTAMMKSVPTSMTFETQNAAVDYARLQANMDAMAMSLAQKGTADEAWKTIFRLPPPARSGARPSRKRSRPRSRTITTSKNLWACTRSCS